MRIGPVSPHGRGCAVGGIAVIATGMVVGFTAPLEGETCGMAPFAALAEVLAKISLACVIGAVAGLLGTVSRGALLGSVIGVFFGPLVHIPWEGPLAQRACGAAIGALIGSLGAWAGRATPIEDRIASGYPASSADRAPSAFWVAVKRGAGLGGSVGVVLAVLILAAVWEAVPTADRVDTAVHLTCVIAGFCALCGSIGLGMLALCRAVWRSRAQAAHRERP